MCQFHAIRFTRQLQIARYACFGHRATINSQRGVCALEMSSSWRTFKPYICPWLRINGAIAMASFRYR